MHRSQAEAYGFKLFESTEWPTLREARIHRNDCLRHHRQRTMLNLGDATQAINSAFCRMTRSVYTLCGFQKLKPVGFCVVCAFCGNYKQRRYKYKSLSPINCNLQFYHSKFRMNPIFQIPPKSSNIPVLPIPISVCSCQPAF